MSNQQQQRVSKDKVSTTDGDLPESKSSTSKPRKRINLRDSALYMNRELSLLAFQRRVLEEAEDPRNPLLERLKFIAILASNLDEFFMVRVGGLKQQIAAGINKPTPDGLTPKEQLAAIRPITRDLMQQSRQCLRNELIPALATEGIHILDYDDLTVEQKTKAKQYFDECVFPILTPMGFDPGHPFPHISNLSLNLAILIRDPKEQTYFARVKVPISLPRLYQVPAPKTTNNENKVAPEPLYFVWMDQIIAANLSGLFPGMEVIEAHPFRVTRNADMTIQELEADDLLETMEQSVRQRRFGAVVRLVIDETMPDHIRTILLTNFNVDHRDVYMLGTPLENNGLMKLALSIQRPDLKEIPFHQAVPPPFKKMEREDDYFSILDRTDVLLHRPYDTFIPVIDFLEKAAVDPSVLAIKQTLYRVGSNSPVVKALLKARENGKQVTVLVELKARFDEESNIEWAKTLESEGVHVVYGLLGLKTHSKIALVVRKQNGHIKRYLHLSTGNYNAVTANLYEDVCFFTTDEDMGADATDLFNYLTGYSAKRNYRKLVIAPINLRSKLESLIKREIAHQSKGKQGHIMLKTNSLVDKGIIKLLYKASMAGIRIELFVRGICCLRPGIKGISENITVTSIVGRFLEHSRIYYFLNGGKEEILIGSADLMPRNIDRRVELLFPIENPRYVKQLRDNVLAIYRKDNIKARRMKSDGTYERVNAKPDEELIACQEVLIRQRKKR